MHNKVYDHKGNEFNSIHDMCDFWNIPYVTFKSRSRSGWDLCKILETPYNGHKTKIIVGGEEFDSITSFITKYNIPKSTYTRLSKQGKTAEDILKIYKNQYTKRKKEYSDHTGKKFKYKFEMLQYYNIDQDVFDYRIANGWSLKDALTTPVKIENVKIKDPITGKDYRLSELAKIYKIPRRTLYGRYKKYSIASSLGISFMIDRRAINVKKEKYNLYVDKRIYKDKDIFECYIFTDDGTSEFKIMSYDDIDKYCIDKYKKMNNSD